jgi:hypothetical protein
MRIFFVTDTGSYAVECSVYRAEDREMLDRLLPPLQGSLFDEREITEITPTGMVGLVISRGHVE